MLQASLRSADLDELYSQLAGREDVSISRRLKRCCRSSRFPSLSPVSTNAGICDDRSRRRLAGNDL